MWPFTRKSPEEAEQAAVAALRLQTATLEQQCAEAGVEFTSILESNVTILMLFGFVDFFSIKYGVRGRRQRAHLAFDVFAIIFGKGQCARMISALEDALRSPESERRSREGYDAARHFEDSGARLLEAYFEGILK